MGIIDQFSDECRINLRNLKRRSGTRPQYRLRLEDSGRCLTYYEVGHQSMKGRRTDLRLAIYGDLRMAEHYCQRYNKEFAPLGLRAEIWSYFGSKPKELVFDAVTGNNPV